MIAAASLTAWHQVSYPGFSLDIQAAGQDPEVWKLEHYLSSDCICSRAVAAYLMKRGPLRQAREEITLIDSDDHQRDKALARDLTGHGFEVKTLSARAASTSYGIGGVPLLEVVSPARQVMFRGGYRERGASPDAYSDLAVLAALVTDKSAPKLPILGCATTQRLRNLMDPLKLKSLNNF